MPQPTHAQIATRVSLTTIFCNFALALFKFAAGIFGNSAAVVSDAVNDASDVFSTFIVLVGVRMAGKESDKDHPYGHERFECVAAIILAVILAATGAGIGYGGVRNIVSGSYTTLAVPTGLALVASIVSIGVKEAMFHYTRRAAKRIDSGALMADAWHHRSDSLSSLGSFLGVLGARAGLPVLDSVACLVICVFIIKAAYDIFVNAIGKMTDRACDDETVDAIQSLVLAQEGVLGIDVLRTRRFGDRIYIDVEISASSELTLQGAHATAHRVHDAIEAQFDKVKHCMVHVNPEGHEEQD